MPLRISPTGLLRRVSNLRLPPVTGFSWRDTHGSGWDSGTEARACVSRLGLNDPPTSVGGIREESREPGADLIGADLSRFLRDAMINDWFLWLHGCMQTAHHEEAESDASQCTQLCGSRVVRQSLYRPLTTDYLY